MSSPAKGQGTPPGAIEVVRIPLGMVSAFLIRGRKAILVDAGAPSSVRRIGRALERLGVAPGDVSLVLLTHGHADHAAGAGAARALTGAPLAMHGNCARDLRFGRMPSARPRTCAAWILEKLFGRFLKIPPAVADREFGDELDLRPFGVEGKAVSTPGHTDGCVSVLLADGQAIVGDLLAGASGGRRAKLLMFLWDLEALERSLGRVADAAPAILGCRSKGRPADFPADLRIRTENHARGRRGFSYRPARMRTIPSCTICLQACESRRSAP